MMVELEMRYFYAQRKSERCQRNDCWWYLVLRDRTESWKGGGGAGMNVEVNGVVAEISDREEMRRRWKRVCACRWRRWYDDGNDDGNAMLVGDDGETVVGSMCGIAGTVLLGLESVGRK